MKVHFVVALFLSTIFFSLIDMNDFPENSLQSQPVDFIFENRQMCGSQSFSNNVKLAFKRESNLDNYVQSQLYLTKEWVVVLNNPYCNYDISKIVDKNSFETSHLSNLLNGTWIITFQTGDLAMEYLLELKSFGYIWNFYPMVPIILDLKYEPNDENYTSGEQWYLNNYGQNNGTSGIDLNTQGAWDNYNGEGIVIGVIDDGIDYQNPDLSPNFLNQYSFDYCGNDTDVMPTDSDTDGEIDWHGTAVSGIVAGKGDNDIGITGVAYNSSIIGMRLIADDCSFDYATDEAEANSLSHRLDLIDIYTNSWGPSDNGLTLGNMGPLALAAIEKGIMEGRDGLGSIYTWANGNGLGVSDQSNKDAYANSRYTIAVGALNWQGEQTSYSEAGSNLLVTAPSHNKDDWVDPAVFTTDILGIDGESVTNYTSQMGGTSAATPMVAGVVALMLEANQNLTWRDVQHILVQSSTKIDSTHLGWFQTEAGYDYNHAYGYGLVDATAAVNMAETWKTVDDEVVVNTSEILVDEYINDNNDIGVSSTVIVNQSINIESIEVLVNITHFFRGDLNVFLTSPNGIVSELVRSHNDDGFHYRNWTFTSMVHWDENSFGDWTIKVNDTESGYTGDFNSWNLTFYGTPDSDIDNDGLSDYVENIIGTYYNEPDSDFDGLLDGPEFYGWTDYLGNIHRTNPKNRDTDNDGLEDWFEGFNDTYITNPNDNDTDDDGLLDGEEINEYFTNPLSIDTDNDTLLDYNEIFAYLFDLPYSDPTKIDSDNDTMPDPYELENNFDPMKQVDGLEDSDYDGFDVNFDGVLDPSEYYTNAMEYAQGTNPHQYDSDYDNMHDGWEYYWGLNPLVDDSEEDSDNDTLSNIYEYDNMLVESKIFSLTDPNLRAYWKFDGTDSSRVTDWTPNANTAVALGQPIRVPTMYFNGMYCDGVDDYARLATMVPSSFTEYTVQSWVKLTNFTEDFGTVFGTAKDGKTWLGVNSDDYFEFRVYSGNKLYISPITNNSVQAKLGVWYHISATYSETSNSLKLYVNGTLVSEEEINPLHSIKAATEYNYMCRGENGEYLNGTIDNIAVWSRELKPDEIQYVFEQPLGFGDYYSFKTEDGILSSNPNSNDTDGDNLSDAEEFYFGLDGYITDPTNPDTDNDGITDYEESMIFHTSPIKNDTDGDGYDDLYSYILNSSNNLRMNQTGDAFPFNPLEWNNTDGDELGDNSDAFPTNKSEWNDTDGDGLGDNIEFFLGTHIDNNDTDGDGVNDYNDTFPLNSTESMDTDGDGVGDNSDDCPEDPRDSNDTDGDGYCDKYDAFPENSAEWADQDKDGYGDNSDKYPNDSTKYSDPLAKSETATPISGQSMDSALLVIISLGGVYFIFKYFVRKL